MVKLISTGAASDRSGTKIVMYGKPKVGKTALIATAPSPVILSSERGLLPLRSYNLPVVQIETYKDLDDVYAWLASSAEAKQFKTVCWDSVSDISETLLSFERKSNPKKNDNWAPYNHLAEKMMDKLRDARNMPGRNWYIICQEEINTDAGGMRIAVPSLPGKALLQNLPYLFDGIFQFVLYVDPVTGQQDRMIKTFGDNTNMGGDRSGALDAWEQPNLTTIFGKMLA